MFKAALDSLKCIMAGFIVKETFFTEKVHSTFTLYTCNALVCIYSAQMDVTVKTLLNTLKDPSLPLLETQVFLISWIM